MIDKSHIGREFPAHAVDVEKGALLFFAKAVGEESPIYVDEQASRDAGYRGLLAPPTYAFSLNLAGPDGLGFLETLGIDIANVLHGEQSFEYFGEICAGDRLTLQGRVTDIYSKKGGALEFVVLEISVTNHLGELVCKLTNTTVVRNSDGGA